MAGVIRTQDIPTGTYSEHDQTQEIEPPRPVRISNGGQSAAIKPLSPQERTNAPRGIGTQPPASRLSFPDKGKETGVIRTQHAAAEPHRPAARPLRAPTPVPVYIRPNAAFRRPAIHYPIKRNIVLSGSRTAAASADYRLRTRSPRLHSALSSHPPRFTSPETRRSAPSLRLCNRRRDPASGCPDRAGTRSSAAWRTA